MADLAMRSSPNPGQCFPRPHIPPERLMGRQIPGHQVPGEWFVGSSFTSMRLTSERFPRQGVPGLYVPVLILITGWQLARWEVVGYVSEMGLGWVGRLRAVSWGEGVVLEEGHRSPCSEHPGLGGVPVGRLALRLVAPQLVGCADQCAHRGQVGQRFA